MVSQKEYDDLLSYIFNRFPSVQKAGFGSAYKPGLENMKVFDGFLGRPHNTYKTIHVAGTNGKGSVCSMLASVLAGSGLKVGLYTSPHIKDFRERMRIIDGRYVSSNPERVLPAPYLISEEDVFNFIMKWRDTFEKYDLSFFEITTGMAFEWFREQNVDVAVIEVGLGGRLDSTNIISPVLSIVTCIGLDHCELLGDTLPLIAGEKAGIIKNGVPALVGESNPETDGVFEDVCKKTGTSLIFADKVIPSLWPAADYILQRMDLQGEYQKKNLRTVLAAVDILKKIPFFSALSDKVSVTGSIVNAARRTDFHGRWERLSSRPWVICDIGHNAHALKYNFGQLKRMLDRGECSSLIIIYGVMADKDLDAIMPLMPENAVYIFTTPSTPRALPSSRIMEKYSAYCDVAGRNKSKIFKSDSVREALEMAIGMAKNLASPDAGRKSASPLIYVGGSTFVVADAVPYFR
ncbi:MAG: bifunctional folylpolyglutamate synthase/dihydrofolate synthase [Bacteroidales bacterium]|jgi:dihydrofolate synthase/folylpolyglutamate synthase|nr:bifunctional folylpolyglutamate synthase/dihydrofolate synthase [Bacteroidales bacterium]MCI1785544.1 bifunctional folylpolyglutamate synthase/dihydrofolate synthase [Bacteroidales bacterium]